MTLFTYYKIFYDAFHFYVMLFIAPLLLLLLLRFYCRLTVSKCESHRSMYGKTVLITGATAGIGKATALGLARRNARVLLACRNLKKAERVKSEIISSTGNKNIEVVHLDLESFNSVRKCAEQLLKSERRLDVLINNAGIADYGLHITKDGCEKNMQINHLGHFLLTLLLLDLLKKSAPSRIINVSSIAYLFGVLNLDDMSGTKHNFILRSLGNYYYRSKLANILFTTELARRLNGTGVTVNAVHPGFIHSDIFYHSNHLVLWIYRFLVQFVGKNTEEGAQTTIYAAIDLKEQNTTGKFFYECREGMMIGQAHNREMAGKLFEISEKLVGESY